MLQNRTFVSGFAALFALTFSAWSQQPSQAGVIHLNAGAIDTSAPQTQARAKAAVASGKQLRLIQFDGPIQPAWVAELEKSGMRIVDYIPDNAYLVYGDVSAVQSMQTKSAGKSHVRWEGAYRGMDKIHPEAAQSATAKASQERPDPTLFSIQLVLDPSINPSTLALIDSLKLKPVVRQGPSAKYYNIIVSLLPGSLGQISDQPDVISIQPYNQPKKRDEKQCIILTGQLSGNVPTGPGSGYMSWLANRGFTQAQFDASGLVVDVTDSPIDNGGTTAINHFALYKDGTISNSSPSRVVYNRLEGIPNTGSVTVAADGHGNLNAHIIAGQVNLTNAPHVDASGYRYGIGVAPFVKVGGSIIFDTDLFTSPDYDNLAARAYRDGARVSGNSWGANTAGRYDLDAQNYDFLVRDAQRSGSAIPTAGNQQMTFVFAAGNAGPGTRTVGSPGTAKNVITVGAAENVRAFGGADGSGVDDTGADSANDVIDFSSRGPCFDSRAKPDIMAPGTHIVGGAPQNAKSMTGTGTALAAFVAKPLADLGVSGGVNSRYFPSSGQQFYTASSGTSHSTPAVAGAAALVYQWFINKGWATVANPASPAMIKAYLLNAARYMTGVDANDSLYSNNQGVGMVNLDTSFDDTTRFLRDQKVEDIFTASGQSRTWTGEVATSAKPLRVTLAWTDAPGSTTGNAYNNNLDLTVTVNGTVYRGNVFSGANSIAGGAADVRNNVESVFLPAGTTGKVTVRVSGININSDGVPNNGTSIDQDFALVAYNFNEVPAPSIVASGSSLVAEANNPTNNAIDPNEVVTVAFGLQNIGTLDASDVTATLLASNGVTPITSSPVSYGSLLAGGGAVTNNFQFSVAGTNGNFFDAVLSLQDGSTNLGSIPYRFRIGPPPPILLSEDFASIITGSSTSPSGSSTAWTGNTNFPTGVNDYQAGGAVRLGSGGSAGSITSRALDLSGNGGVFSVQFDVKGWSTVEGSIKITVGSLAPQTVPYTAVLSGAFESKFANFTGGQANSTVKIETTAGRAFIDNVVIASQAVFVAPPVINSSLTSTATVGSAYTYSITATENPTSYGATGLPAGLSINTSTGVISGTPTTAGTSNITITATNAGGTDAETLVLSINNPPQPVISSQLTATGVAGSAFSYQITASNNPTSYGASGLPAGLSINTTTGAITGTPSAAGTSNVTISATNPGGTGSATLVITINVAPPVISSGGTASGIVGTAFSYQITASGSPTSYGASNLPAGLSVDTGTGLISGSPTTAGTTTATVRATNAGGTGSKSLVISITPSGAPSLIAGWDFQTTNNGGTAAAAAPNSPTVYAANFGSGTIYLNGSNGSSTWITNTTGNELTAFSGTTLNAASGFSTTTSGSAALALVAGTGQSANGKRVVFAFSMSNRSNLSVSYAAQRGGTTAFNTNSWEWSTNGSNWTAIGSITNLTSGSFGVVGLSNISSLDGVTNAFLRLTVTGATASSGNNRLDNIQLQAVAANTAPSVQASGSVPALSTTYGTASVAGSFALSGSNLTEGITVTPPSGFEVSKTVGGASGYSSNQVVGAAGTVAPTTVYVRLASNIPAGSYSGDVLCNSAGSAGATISIPGSAVAKKDLSVTGLTADNKVYDGTTSATFTGTPAYDGLVNGDSFAVSGSTSASFASAAAGTGKTVTVTGYNAPSSNYNVIATTLTADITPKPVTVSGLSGVSKVYDGTTAATISGTPSLSGIESADNGNVSLGGNLTASFVSASVGADIGISASGYELTGSAASNYSVTPPDGLTADITARPATVTASDRTKPFGTALALGPNQITGFVATGLAAGEKIDKVTLTASGGTATDAPAGTYSIVPSDAAATPAIPPNPFRAENYSITYVAGTLTVTEADAPTFDEWAAQKGLTGADASTTADPDKDGLANLLEYYMGLEPLTPDKNVVSMGWNPGNPSSLSMTYRRAKGTTGVTGGVVWSSLLTSNNWSGTGVITSTNNEIPQESSYEELTSTVTNAPSENLKFLRLRVTQP